MSFSVNNRHNTGGVGSPKIDLYDPVLYVPLWHTKMVARGGTIKNGTGTMDVSPQNLAVGTNTITVTAAGTLIVSMPEGGTVASGTMTVTGSPVTVSAGIATTITTTGAIGNITVSPSNIIRSKDKNNHALTITGATWNSQGRTFDGLDDYLDCGDNIAFDLASNFTIVANIIPKFQATQQIIGRDNGTIRNYLLLIDGDNQANFQIFIATVNYTVFSDLALTLNSGYHITATYDNNTIKVYVNGQIAATPVSATGSIDNGDTSLLVGKRDGGRNFNGVISEVFIYNNRVLTAGESLNHYIQSKRRLPWLA